MSDDEKPDDSEPTPERQTELRAAYEANVAAGKAPYAGVEIRTRGELSWVMRAHRWSSSAPLREGSERANLSGALLFDANLSGVNLNWANLSGADLSANLSGANLMSANLSGANLYSANLSGANLIGANLNGANLFDAELSGANLYSARMDVTTDLREASLDMHTLLADVVWNGVPLTRLNWPKVAMLGEEQVARQLKDKEGKRKGNGIRMNQYAEAVLANRQVATVLRSQGVNEHADRFAYHAQLCQRRVLRLQRHYLRYLGSLFLDLISGYGYRPLRSFATYLLVVTVFGLAYWALGVQTGHTLTWNEAGVVSLTAFHGRGFFATAFQPGDPQAAAAAIEAVIGLLIEITFIATFTQRFFAR